MIYDFARALFDSLIKWATATRVVHIVGGGRALADRVRAAIRSRTR